MYLAEHISSLSSLFWYSWHMESYCACVFIIFSFTLINSASIFACTTEEFNKSIALQFMEDVFMKYVNVKYDTFPCPHLRYIEHQYFYRAIGTCWVMWSIFRQPPSLVYFVQLHQINKSVCNSLSINLSSYQNVQLLSSHKSDQKL